MLRLLRTSFRRSVPQPRSDEGFVIVDALTAVFLITLSLAAALNTQAASARVSAVAQERRDATNLLRSLLASPQAPVGAIDHGRFRVTFTEAAIGGERPMELCQRAAAVTSVVSARVYEATTVVTCERSAP